MFGAFVLQFSIAMVNLLRYASSADDANVQAVPLPTHDPVVRTNPVVPCTGAEEWTIVAFAPPTHIRHTAGGRSDFAGK